MTKRRVYPLSTKASTVLLLVGFAVSGAGLAAQGPPQTPMPPPPQGGPMHSDGRPYGRRGFGMRMDETTRILPPGPWWKDQDIVQRLELTPDQQKRIEDLFLQSKVTLIRLHANLDEEEVQLEPMLNANPIDQGKVLAEISKVADLRAELEKATARMLLQVRGVLTQTQWTRLQQERPSGMRQHMFTHGPDGPRGRADRPGPGGAQAEP